MQKERVPLCENILEKKVRDMAVYKITIHSNRRLSYMLCGSIVIFHVLLLQLKY
jgi:hypothetical protein